MYNISTMYLFIFYLMCDKYILICIFSYLKLNISIRDYLIWVKFIESMMNCLPNDDVNYNSLQTFITLYKEGAILTFLDNKTKTDLS